jgi:hypothetical protein
LKWAQRGIWFKNYEVIQKTCKLVRIVVRCLRNGTAGCKDIAVSRAAELDFWVLLPLREYFQKYRCMLTSNVITVRKWDGEDDGKR